MASVLKPQTASASHRETLEQIVFDGNFEQVHQGIREILFDPLFDPHANLTLNEAGRLSYERSRLVHRKLDKPLGMLRDPLRLFALAEWPGLLDVACFSLLMVHYNLCFGTVFDHGIEREDIADLVQELNELSSFGPYMATELGYGNNVAALRTEAVYDHATRTFVLNTPDAAAQKYMSYSGFGDIPKIAVVMARLKIDQADCGVFPFLVRISTEVGLCEGIRTVPCPEKPVQGLDNGLTWFDHVRIPARQILLGNAARITEDGQFKPIIGNARSRFLRAMSRIVPGRLCVSSSATGLGRASVYIALRYAQKRLTNAPGTNEMAVIEYRSHQRALFTALAKAFAMTLLVNHAKREYLTQGAQLSASAMNLVNIVKAVSTWEMSEVITTCRERCGAQGIFSVNRIVDYGLLLPGLITAEGDNQVLLSTTAGQMLAQAWPQDIPERPGYERRKLTDAAWLIELLRVREYALWEEGREAKDRTQQKDYFAALNDAINPGIEMARLHGMRVALQCLQRAASETRDPVVAEALGMLASLFGMTELQRDAGWYLAHGLVGREHVLALPGAIDAMCIALREHAPMLIDGFGLSPALLRAPIAHDDYMDAFCSHASDAAKQA